MPDLGRLALRSAKTNTEGQREGATLDSTLEDGADSLVRQLAKVATGFNPDLSGHGIVPQESNVGGGLSLRALSPLKDLPGGLLATLGKYFTRELPPGLMPSEPVEVSLSMLGELHPMATPDIGGTTELGI
ncbi:MAG: hypothetical protein P4L85_14110 [Paludisphaera borealis]|uniref:hypothetical protein n=1 Tax=Paludisphaera borealis TaxID=1387353 RepID=UPI00283EC72B|nr:hypothetical protein [Paludisphaera borealis]MDR3620481.1 hypothetical protein [Paludisphaera borealis]